MNNAKASKTTSTPFTNKGSETYLEVKEFPDKCFMNNFLNKQDNTWKEYEGPLNAGKYIQYGYDTINGKLVPRFLTTKEHRKMKS
jgi:hypothetical protein